MAVRRLKSGLVVPEGATVAEAAARVAEGDTTPPAPTPTTPAGQVKARRRKAEAAFASVAEAVTTSDHTEPVATGVATSAGTEATQAKPKRKRKPKATPEAEAVATEEPKPEVHKCAKCGKDGASVKVEKKDHRGRVLRAWWFHEQTCAPAFMRANGLYSNHADRRAAGIRGQHVHLPLTAKKLVRRCRQCKATGVRLHEVPMGGQREQVIGTIHKVPHTQLLCGHCLEQRRVNRRYTFAPAV